MTRWKASLVHLSASLIIATAVLAIMLLLWYPYPLFAAVGGQMVLMILLGVDMTVGPLITLIIFNPKKSRKALTFDLSVIAALQIAALLFGMSVVFQARPVFVVFSKDSFDLVTANLLSESDVAQARNPDYRLLPLTGPVYVYSEMPNDIQERNIVALSVLSGKDLPLFPRFYLPYAEHMKEAARVVKPIIALKELNPERATEIDEMVRHSGHAETDMGYLPLRAKYQDQAVILEKGSGKVLTILPMNPWSTPDDPTTPGKK